MLSRAKLSEEIADYLRDEIISGRRRAGERIVLDDVAFELGVSRMPVRDAVLALSHEGLTEVRPRRGVVVATTTRDDVVDAYEVLAFTSGLLAERSVCRLTPADLDELARLHAAMDPAGGRTPAELEQLNWAFHRVINRASGARKLQWLMRALTRNVPQHFYEFIPDWPTRSRAEHAALLKALQVRDKRLARRIAQQHVLSGGRMLAEYLEQ